MKRSRISRSKSKRSFTKNAMRTHKKNLLRGDIMRGGYRL